MLYVLSDKIKQLDASKNHVWFPEETAALWSLVVYQKLPSLVSFAEAPNHLLRSSEGDTGASYREGCPLEAAIEHNLPSQLQVTGNFTVTGLMTVPVFHWSQIVSSCKAFFCMMLVIFTLPFKEDRSSAPRMWRSSVDWSFYNNQNQER